MSGAWRGAPAVAAVVFWCVIAASRATAQAGAWVASPADPTVGDTVWLARQVTEPAGWRVRPGKLEAANGMEPLGDPAVLRAPAGWITRYAVALWEPGPRDIALPPVWRLAPNGRTDSLPGGTAHVDVRSVIPDSVKRPEPRPALAPLRPERRRPLVLLAAVALSAGLLVGGVWWRRRPGPPPGEALPVPVEGEVPDARWLAAGEPKAVAARATERLRAVIARAHPRASLALSTTECLAVLEREMPDIPYRQLADVLTQLERASFGAAQGGEVAALVERARALAAEVAP